MCVCVCVCVCVCSLQLEKLESSPPGNPNQERQSSSQSIFKSTKLSKSATHPASAQTASTKKASTQTASTPTASKETASTPTASKETASTPTASKETASPHTAGSKTFTRDRASRHPASRHTASSSKTARSHETRLERKRYKDVSIPLWCGDPAPLTPTPHSRRSPTPGEPHPNSNGVPQPSKIDLAEGELASVSTVYHLSLSLLVDTLETLRSKVEAQKQALQETNSRLESFRRPLTSEPCVYPLPEGENGGNNAYRFLNGVLCTNCAIVLVLLRFLLPFCSDSILYLSLWHPPDCHNLTPSHHPHLTRHQTSTTMSQDHLSPSSPCRQDDQNNDRVILSIIGRPSNHKDSCTSCYGQEGHSPLSSSRPTEIKHQSKSQEELRTA